MCFSHFTDSNRLIGCGHIFCLTCLAKLLEEKEPTFGDQYRCPICRMSIYGKPRPDRKIEAIVSWLQSTQGGQVSATPSISSDILDKYFYILS